LNPIKTLLKAHYNLKKKAFKRLTERSFWVFEYMGYISSDDIAGAIKQSITLTRRKGNDAALIKTIDNKFFVIVGQKHNIPVPNSILRKAEIELFTYRDKSCNPDECTLTGAAIAGLPADTIRKAVIAGVCESTEFFKVFTLKEGMREELKRFINSLRENETEYLKFTCDLKLTDYDELLSKFFDIAIYHDIDAILKNVFQIDKPRNFEEVIEYIINRYDSELLDQLADEIKEAIENVIKAKSAK